MQNRKEFSKAAGANAKTCTRDQFLAYAKAGFAKCKDQGDAKAVVLMLTKRVKDAQRRAKQAAAASKSS